MPDREYEVGDRVEVTDRGSFTGVIVGFGSMYGIGPDRRFEMDGTRSMMVIMPDSPDLIRYFGGNGTTKVGAAHWPAMVRLLDA